MDRCCHNQMAHLQEQPRIVIIVRRNIVQQNIDKYNVGLYELFFIILFIHPSIQSLSAMLSNRSAEETSESTGTRSESSTPVQRCGTGHGQQQHPIGALPMPTITRCNLCDVNVREEDQLMLARTQNACFPVRYAHRFGRPFQC